MVDEELDLFMAEEEAWEHLVGVLWVEVLEVAALWEVVDSQGEAEEGDSEHIIIPIIDMPSSLSIIWENWILSEVNKNKKRKNIISWKENFEKNNEKE